MNVALDHLRRSVLARTTRALDAFHDGDVDLGMQTLADLNADLEHDLPRRFPCPDCAAIYEWGEQLIDHRERMHREPDDDNAADRQEGGDRRADARR